MIRACGFVRSICMEAVGAATINHAASGSASITVPHAIKRGQTDLLKALADTVGVDVTAPHFSFIDDPIMIPTTSSARRQYYLAKEMGKRAARHLAAEWPTLFQYDRDEPRLNAFRPQTTPDAVTVEPTEENLRQMIEKKLVQQAVKLYERIRSSNVEVSHDVQMGLFRLVVFYNGKNIPSSEIEEWHGWRTMDPINEAKEPPSWEKAGLADLMFETFEKTEEVYSLMIAGLCKFRAQERARSLYKEMRKKNMTPRVEAFRGLIDCASSVKEATALLKDMSNLGVLPDIRVFNAAIAASNRAEKASGSQLADFAGNFVREAISCGCQPSLRTYLLVLQAAGADDCRGDSSKLTLCVTYVSQILDELEKRESIESTESNDQAFYLAAMNIAENAGDLGLAERIETLYRSSANHAQLPALTDEAVFYNGYLRLSVLRLPLDEVNRRYRSLVPRIVGTSYWLCSQMLERISENASANWSLLRRVIEDAIASRMMVNLKMSQKIRSTLLSLNLKELTVESREQFRDLVRRMVGIWVEFSEFTEPNEVFLQHKWSRAGVAECSLLLLRLGDRKEGWRLLELLLLKSDGEDGVSTVEEFGFPPPDVMRKLLDEALQYGDWENASNCLEIIAKHDKRAQLGPIVEKIINKCSLTPLQVRILDNYVRLRQ